MNSSTASISHAFFAFIPKLLVLLVAPLVVGMSFLGCSAPNEVPVREAPQPTATPTEENAVVEVPVALNVEGEGIERGPAASLDPVQRNDMYDAPPPMTIDPETYYYATIRTAKGDIRIQLFAERAPKTVNNFVFLAREGFYDDTTFHRVIDGFMAQAGDPLGTGGGGPGYEFEDEFYPGLVFDQSGLLAMANRGPGTNGSQFFITFAPTEWLTGNHTIFGKVIEGEEVLGEITRIDPEQDVGMIGDKIFGIDIHESDVSILPTPTPSPPTPTPTATPTPFAPSALDADDRPLATIEPAARVNYFNTAPDVTIDTSAEYQALVSTSQGDFVVDLFAEEAPVAVNNFVMLAELGFYDDTPISLVRPEDSIIFGSPDANALNDAGYRIAAELNPDIELEFGVLTYLPVENREADTILSSSSQILLALVEPPPDLAGQLGFFGQVVDGLEVLPELTTDDTIKSITISTRD